MIYEKEKTLFVTDMDGTVLDSNAQLSAYTAEVLREVVFLGYNLTVATGRFPGSPKRIFEQHGITLNLPIIGRNGVLILDPVRDEYLQIHKIPAQSGERILELIKKHNAQLLLLDTVDKANIPMYNRRGFDGFVERPDDMDSVIYFAVDGPQQQLAPLFEEALKLPEIGGVLGYDNYLSGVWFAELFNQKASKGNGVQAVKEQYGFSRVVCFGDNVNDLSMFDMHNESYVPENAVPEAKAMATSIIASNDADGVARWLEENLLS